SPHNRRRRGGGHGGGHGNDERWLLTYADMITLLMALFMVLFSISSVNISKYQVLQHALKAAFSGNILPGGKSIAQQGATANSSHAPSTTEAAAVVPLTAIGSRLETTSATHTVQGAVASQAQAAASQAQAAAAQSETTVFAHIKRALDAYAAKHGFASKVKTSIEPRGLVIRVLTDDLLFASGQATLAARAHALLGEIGQLLNVDTVHPIDVEGNTDNVPIHSSVFPSNWELSTARSSTVAQFLTEHGLSPHRLTASGYADQRPLASNATAAGRTRNRRVEIVMKRIYGADAEP
ncbi:MAG TPA: flagellar motor protein MotB, partial [Solirubrobacteraceae bacterium]|nr:flagellar motor protein MotB [Solirubrobacteraceae bacterium]